MKIITDSEQILNAMKNLNALEALEKYASEIRILEYETHELLMSPVQHNDNLLFIFEGSIIFYVLQENGQIISLDETMERACWERKDCLTLHMKIFMLRHARE